MDEKKNGSQAFTATGTASLLNINNSTGATIYQGENYAKAELDAVNMDPNALKVSATDT